MSRYLIEFDSDTERETFECAIREFASRVEVLDGAGDWLLIDDHKEGSADGDHTYTVENGFMQFKHTGMEM